MLIGGWPRCLYNFVDQPFSLASTLRCTSLISLTHLRIRVVAVTEGCWCWGGYEPGPLLGGETIVKGLNRWTSNQVGVVDGPKPLLELRQPFCW